MVGLPDSEKNVEDMGNCLHTIPECDRRTDRRTDILPRYSPSYAYASRVKNRTLRYFDTTWSKILTYASFDSLCCLINIKVKSFKNIQRFYLNVRCQKLQQMFKVLSFSLDTAHKSHDRFATRLLPRR